MSTAPQASTTSRKRDRPVHRTAAERGTEHVLQRPSRRSRRSVLRVARHERPVVRDVSRRQRRLVDHAGGYPGAVRRDGWHRPGVPHERRLGLAECGRLDASRRAAPRTRCCCRAATSASASASPRAPSSRSSAVDDPYGYASASELSLFRRPLPSANLQFLSAVMWDGREGSLGSQAIDATLGHAQATGTVQAQMDAIVAFESSIYGAVEEGSGRRRSRRRAGRAVARSSSRTTAFYIGINDPIGMNPTGHAVRSERDDDVRRRGRIAPATAARRT